MAKLNLMSLALETLQHDTLIALESEESTGKAKREIEYVLYAKLSDTVLLESANHKEHHHQVEVKIPKTDDNQAAGRIRIRKTTEGNVIKYVQTTKTSVQDSAVVSDIQKTDAQTDMKKDIEVAIEVTEDAFLQFCLFATAGMIKERYTFNIPDSELKWEVDVFILPDGSQSEWVKIDLEVETPLETLPALPEGFTEVITNQRDQQTPEEKAKIQELYSTIFLRTVDTTEYINPKEIPNGEYEGLTKGYITTFTLNGKECFLKGSVGVKTIHPIKNKFTVNEGHVEFQGVEMKPAQQEDHIPV